MLVISASSIAMTLWAALAAASSYPAPAVPDAIASQRAPVLQVNIFSSDGSDPRQIQIHSGADRVFAPIGRILTNQRVPSPDGDGDGDRGAQRSVNLDGTAFLVSPCYALTNYHVVFGGSRAPSTQYTSTLYTFDGEGSSMIGTRATPVVWGGMARVRQPSNDWVLLKLDACIGGRIGWMDLAGNDNRIDLLAEPVASVGFAADKDPSSLWRDDCHLRHAAVGSFLDDCAVAEGSSGSPIVSLISGHPRVIALSEGELNRSSVVLSAYVSQDANVASDLHAILPGISRLIGADIAAFGLPNPAIQDR
jgi:hypothetical protein